MSHIRVTAEILAGNLGDGWNDQNAAAHALGQYTHDVWRADLQQLADAGHDVAVIILIRENTSGAHRPVQVECYDDGEIDGPLERHVEDSLTDEQVIWDRWYQSAEAAKLAA